MIKRISIVLAVLFALSFFVGCEPPDDDVIAKVITSATSVAFTQIIQKNPAIEDDVYAYALLNKQAIVERTINSELAKSIFNNILQSCQDLDANDKQQLLTLFSIVLPLIEIPPEGVLSDRTRFFMIAFLDGIINVVETKRAMEGNTVIDPVMWDVRVWLIKETINGLHNS